MSQYRQASSAIPVFYLKYSRHLALLVLAILFFIVVIGASALPRLSTQYTMRQFLPAHHALLDADTDTRLRFGLSDREPLFLLLDSEKGDWFEQARMKQLQDFDEVAAKMPGVINLTTLANVEGASSSKEGITVGKLVELNYPSTWKERFLQDPLLADNLISSNGKTTLAIINIEELDTKTLPTLLQALREKARSAFPEASVHLGGAAAIQAEMNFVLSAELKNFLLLSLLASLFTLLLFFKNISSVIIPTIIMVLANIISLAWMVFAGISFTVLSTTLPILVSITVISMASHTMLRFAADWKRAKERQDNPNKLRVLAQSFYVLLMPNFLTAVSTAVGFLAISFTSIPLIRQYGISVGLSVFIAWLSIMAALPPLLVLFPVPVVRAWTANPARWSVTIVQHGKIFAALAIGLAAVFLWQGRALNWSPRLFDDLPADRESRLTTEQIDKNLGGMIPLEVEITIPKEENPWNEPARIRGLDQLEKKWRVHPVVGAVSALPDLLRSVARLSGLDLPIDRKSAAEYGFLYSFGETNMVTKYLTAEGASTRINLRLHDVPADEIDALKQTIITQAQSAFPDAKVSLAGMATTVHALNNELSSELIFGFWQALALISVLVFLVFRSWRWTLVAVIPNLLSPAMLLGALAIFHTPVKPGIALIFSIALGIAFDNTVYLLGRLRYLLKERRGQFPVARAWYQEANLCLHSSLALSAGFLVFLGSYFSLNKYFGAYMLISMAGGLLGDLVLLPAILSLTKNQFLLPTIERKPAMSKSVVAICLILSFPLSAFAVDPNNADQILKAVEKNVNSKDEVADLKMVIVEPSGAKKNRDIEIKRKGEEDKQKVLVRMQSPADLKGTALLSLAEGSGNDQWLYLPSSKQTRRILSSKKSSSFMDSELSYEDMGTNSDRKMANKVLRQEKIGSQLYSVIESKPLAGESAYGKILSWISIDNFLVSKMEYYDKSMKLLKISNFSEYKKFSGIWRAQKVEVQNVQNKRGTVLELANLQINKSLSDDEFTEGSLADAD